MPMRKLKQPEKRSSASNIVPETHECFLCGKPFQGTVLYYHGKSPVCTWKCLYKEIKKEYKKILSEPLVGNQPKKRGRKKKSNGQELGKE